jgi:hypothetical protein
MKDKSEQRQNGNMAVFGGIGRVVDPTVLYCHPFLVTFEIKISRRKKSAGIPRLTSARVSGGTAPFSVLMFTTPGLIRLGKIYIFLIFLNCRYHFVLC